MNKQVTSQFQYSLEQEEDSGSSTKCDKWENMQINFISDLIFAFHGQVFLRFVMPIDTSQTLFIQPKLHQKYWVMHAVCS